jgi:hypothetical protein
MSLLKFLTPAILAGAMAATVSGQALAGQGKVGLWTIAVTTNMGGMPQISAADQKRMAQMGVHMNGNTVMVQHCMTAAEVAAMAPPQMHENNGCSMSSMTMTGSTYSATMTCTGQMQGSGHMSVTYDSAEHYSGKMVFSGMAQGQPVSMNQTFDGKWVSASCGTVTH